jgi:hypothetical protein
MTMDPKVREATLKIAGEIRDSVESMIAGGAFASASPRARRSPNTGPRLDFLPGYTSGWESQPRCGLTARACPPVARDAQHASRAVRARQQYRSGIAGDLHRRKHCAIPAEPQLDEWMMRLPMGAGFQRYGRPPVSSRE